MILVILLGPQYAETWNLKPNKINHSIARVAEPLTDRGTQGHEKALSCVNGAFSKKNDACHAAPIHWDSMVEAPRGIKQLERDER